MAPNRGPLQQSYLKQVELLEAIIANNSWSKTKETRRIKKLQATIEPGVANQQQTKLLGLSRIATITTMKK